MSSAGLTVVVHGLTLVSSVLFAYYFGAHSETDLYFFLVTVSTLATGLISSVNLAVLVPEGFRRRETAGPEAMMAFFNGAFLALVVLIWFPVFLALAFPQQVMGWVSRFSTEALAPHVALIRWALVVLPLQVLAQFFSDLLLAMRRFSLSVVLLLAMRVFVLGWLVVGHGWLGVTVMPIAMAAALLMQIGVSAWLLRRLVGWSFGCWSSPFTGAATREGGWTLLGAVATAAAGYVPDYLLTGYGGGLLTVVYYARRLVEVPATLVLNQASGILGVRFSEQLAQQDWTALNAAYRRGNALAVALLMPMGFFCWAFAPELVLGIFRRGSFTDESARLCADFMQWFALALPFLAVNSIAARVIMAAQRMRRGVWFQIVVNVLRCVAFYAAIHWGGVLAYPVTHTALMVGTVALLSSFLGWVLPELRFEPVVRMLVWSAMVSAAAGAAATGLRWVWPDAAWPAFLAVGGIVFALVLRLLFRHVPQGEEVIGWFKGVTRKLWKGS